MTDTWAEHIRLTIALIAVVDPIGAIPMFLSATEDQTEAERKRTATVAAATVGATLLAASLFGESILALFGIGLPSFQVGGGILLLLMAISMLHAHQSGATHRPEEDEEARGKHAVGVVPLGIPLMAGPGSIALVILHNPPESEILHSVYLNLSIAIIALLVWVTLGASAFIGRKLGTTGINICTRLMGLLLAAIAVELIAAGMVKLFPGLA
jgi:multiple antibiotic resistance protein